MDLQNTKEKGSIVSFALVALLLFGSVLVISAISILFLREITIKEKLNHILRTAEGKVGLWTVDPQSADYQTALEALITNSGTTDIQGWSGGGAIESTLLNYGKGTKAWFAFLPPGECAKLDNGRLLCNSHMCALPPAPTDTESEMAMCYACQGDGSSMPSLFPCSAIPEGWHSCAASQGSLCAQPSSSDSFLAKVEEFPTEVVAVIKTSLFGGIFNVERKVMVQGYPRVLNQEIVTAQVPTPVCGIWTETTSCPVPASCGDPTQTYQVPLNWMCNTPTLGCRLLSDPSGVCGPPPGGSIDCPYQLCESYSCVTSSCPVGETGSVQVCHRFENGVDRGVAADGLCNSGAGCPNNCEPPADNSCVYLLGYNLLDPYDGAIGGERDVPQCLKDEFLSDRRCQFNQDNEKMEYCAFDLVNRTCNWTVDYGQTGVGYYGGGHGRQGHWWLDSCFTTRDVFNDPQKRNCMVRCRVDHGFVYEPTIGGYWYTPGPGGFWGNGVQINNMNQGELCIRDTCGMRRYELNDLVAFLGVPMPSNQPAFCSDGTLSYQEFQDRFEDYACVASWFLDANCRVVPFRNNICGVLELNLTPVSLVWDERPVSAKVVNFSLDPTLDASWSIWKGSSARPLLVYDPEHSGKITSAMQLFGKFALGGQEALLLKSSLRNVKPGKAWENGYQALSRLDLDQDGKLSGKELEPLALWFDDNQDAESQPGEVRSLTSQEVRTIYYRNYEVQGNELVMQVGYERSADGQTIRGRSVDWFGAVYRTKSEAMLAMIGESDLSIEPKSTAKAKDIGSKGLPKVAKASKQTDSTADLGKLSELPAVSGYWQWGIDGEVGKSAPGYFVLNDDGLYVDGWTVVNAEAAPAGSTVKVDEVVMAIPLVGNKLLNDDGNQEITWTVKNQKTEATSWVSVAPSGKTMFGRTVQKVNKGGEEVSMEYSWHARRIKQAEKR